ncbi:DNA-binding domain-containing protein [Abyssalbus ytuae]|uniref:DUF4469 domain-containing protein n=1 Tax=Abyssalbus ytuae TaxID=2926907 RepID=A0A9E7D0H1_9FLAO|nr:DNA-binding domain-containing protein [Abyssalbus ytuae]UOB18415.1 DUF4469 domain-containing protein [Abyssalbus ytuae]
MSLKYSLNENLLTPQPDDYSARPQGVKSHDLESIIAQMVSKGSTVTRTDILAVLNNFFEVVGAITANGETINTDLFKTNFSISGVFEGATDGFDKSRHTIKINTNTGKVLKEALAKIQVEKITTPEIIPHIIEVKDSISGSVNDHITSNGILEITGSLLKIEGDHPDNGIYLIAEDGTKNKVTTIADNKPGRLFAVLPTLTAGEYTLEVTTQYNGGNSELKAPRTGTFNKPLTAI